MSVEILIEIFSGSHVKKKKKKKPWIPNMYYRVYMRATPMGVVIRGVIPITVKMTLQR